LSCRGEPPDRATPSPTGGPVIAPTIAICGAGLAGLTLARVLHVAGVRATVFEADDSVSARTQGGQLDLHEEDGQRALAWAGLTEQYRSIIHRGGGARRVYEPGGAIVVDVPDDGSMTRPETLRGDIRRILLESLPADVVQWGRKLLSVKAIGGGRHELSFSDGATTTADVLVGADGTWSKVRALVSDVRPVYSGMSYIDSYLTDVENRHPAIAATVGDGALYCVQPGRALLAHREPGNVVHTYVILHRPLDWFDAIDVSDARSSRARIAAEFEDWSPRLTALVSEGEGAPVVRAIHQLPDRHRWDRTPGVTLVGDAAHVTVPGGDGANLAMLDGAELGRALAAHLHEPEVALGAYEEVMFPRSEAAAVAAHRTIDTIFGSGAPHGVIDLFRRVLAEQQN
jgi:2-polyprenyl-6-methoxyphenol hydroxylase-like FAD-dependent oxidoreductase